MRTVFWVDPYLEGEGTIHLSFAPDFHRWARLAHYRMFFYRQEYVIVQSFPMINSRLFVVIFQNHEVPQDGSDRASSW